MNPDTRRKPRQKRSKDKVDKILDAVEQLASEKGLDDLTTTNIAATTGFAVGTIYQYFNNRTALLLAAEERLFGRLTQHLYAEAKNVMDGPVDEAVEKLIDVYIQSAKTQPGYIALLKFSVLNKPPGINEAVVLENMGELISTLIRVEHPDICETQLQITLKTVVGILTVLTDMVILEPDPQLQTRFQTEMVAQCKYALHRIGVQSVGE